MTEIRFSMEIGKSAGRMAVLLGFFTFIVPCSLLVLGIIGGTFEEVRAALLPIGVWVLLFALLFPQSYVLRSDELAIRRGMRRTLVRYRDLSLVRSLTSGDSVYTVEIETRNDDSFLIAPKDRGRFLSELEKRAPRYHETSDFEEESAELETEEFSEDDERLRS